MEHTNNFNYPEFASALRHVLSDSYEFTVLVIEENDDLRGSLRQSLKDRYKIVEAGDPLQGLELAYNLLPDVIITDLVVLHPGGDSLCAQIKQSEKTSHIPIIILTSRNDGNCRVQSYYQGADDVIVRPYQLVELQIRIQNLIQVRRVMQEKFRRYIELKPYPVEALSEDELFLQRVMEVMEMNMANPLFGSKIFARKLGLSQTRLYRKLIDLTGYSSNDFIRIIRLKRAADLLNKQVGNVSEVAYKVGFSSLSYFAKCFKQMHQYSPRDYARRAGV